MSDIAISHLRNCPVTKEDVQAADDIFWTEPWEPEGKDSLVSKQTCPGWEFSCSPVHSRDSLGCGSFRGHHVCKHDPIPGDIIM